MARLKKLSISIKWEPRDIWIGVFNDMKVTDRIYICIIPCFPVIIFYNRYQDSIDG